MEIVRITGEEGTQVSALVNEALAYYLRIRQSQESAKELIAEFGFTPEEIAEADRILDEAGVDRWLPSPSWPG